jgi:hypothetical protein
LACLPARSHGRSTITCRRGNTNGAIPSAQKIQTLFVDDIDGGEAEGTVRFGLDGVGYEIDLSVVHSEELHKALAPYITHARKSSGTRRAARGRSGNGSAVDTHKVREWARGQGIEIKDRGRVPADIVEKYRQATGQ